MNKRGQSIVEYALIALLVILGIILMGPYVLRSVGAHFKLWDEGVQDSFDENINQAPINDLNIIVNCSCTPYIAGSCGGACAPTQRSYTHSCTPPLCDGAPSDECINDNSCCTTYFPESCGTIAPDLPLPPNNCYIGYRIWLTQCSSLPIECIADPKCAPSCQGPVSSTANPCPNYNNGLTVNTPITYVAAESNCVNPPPPWCQYYCVPPNVLNPTGTACVPLTTSWCGNAFWNKNNGWVDQWSCNNKSLTNSNSYQGCNPSDPVDINCPTGYQGIRYMEGHNSCGFTCVPTGSASGASLLGSWCGNVEHDTNHGTDDGVNCNGASVFNGACPTGFTWTQYVSDPGGDTAFTCVQNSTSSGVLDGGWCGNSAVDNQDHGNVDDALCFSNGIGYQPVTPGGWAPVSGCPPSSTGVQYAQWASNAGGACFGN